MLKRHSSSSYIRKVTPYVNDTFETGKLAGDVITQQPNWTGFTMFF